MARLLVISIIVLILSLITGCGHKDSGPGTPQQLPGGDIVMPLPTPEPGDGGGSWTGGDFPPPPQPTPIAFPTPLPTPVATPVPKCYNKKGKQIHCENDQEVES